jgi:hypothetical protein
LQGREGETTRAVQFDFPIQRQCTHALLPRGERTASARFNSDLCRWPLLSRSPAVEPGNDSPSPIRWERIGVRVPFHLCH